jgi:threonylcarbamoyladenosine tRNA methylthiotransferase MtaB
MDKIQQKGLSGYMNKTAAFLSLGCKVNSYETEAMRGMFEAAGYQIVDFKDTADVYIVNTCTVTNIADRKSRQMLHQAKHRNPKAVIAAVGCYVQAAEEVLQQDSAVDLVVGNNKKSDIVAMVERCMGSSNKEELVEDISGHQEYEELHVITTMERTRAFIKIQDGCNRFCSYCIIPYVRGRVRSRREEDILEEVNHLAQKGYQEIVLTGIHISSYGTDRKHQSSEDETMKPLSEEQDVPLQEDMPLAKLIIEIGKIVGIKRIRLGSLEPRIITDEFLKRISSVQQFCPHFHLSLQSGSDSVLKRMNRKYLAGEYEDRVQMIKEYFELPSFTTDVIVGFPGETEQEFLETMEFVKRISFSHIHVFKYSKREGTKAADMPGQIPEEIKSSRSDKLIVISNLMAEEYRQLFVGRIEEILFEESVVVEGRKYQVGHNKHYLKLAVPSDEELSNKLLKAKVVSFLSSEILLCEIIH